MTTINRMKVSCGALQGLKYDIISINDMSQDLNTTVKPIQPVLNSFEYNRTLNNDICFALKYGILEAPSDKKLVDVKIKKFKPYRLYNNKIKVLGVYNNTIKG